MSVKIKDHQQQRFEAWARDEGLIQESHGIRSVNSMTELARKAWDAALAQRAASQPIYFGFSDELAAIEAAKTLGMIGVPLNEHGALDLCHAFLKLRKPVSERDAALPAAVIAWYAAEEARIEAVGKYNGKLTAAKEHDFPGPDVSAEFQAMMDAGNAAHHLLRPMYDAIADMSTRQGEKGGAPIPAPNANTERAWYKEWLATLTDNVTVDQIEFGRRVWAERARRAAKGGA